MTVDRPPVPWCYYNISRPVHVQARFLTAPAGLLTRFLTVQAGLLTRFLTVQAGLLTPLSDSAHPRPVLNRADRFIIRLTG